MTEDADTTLFQVLEQLEIELPADQVGQLERYCQLLWDWNTRLNLTRHTDYRTFAVRDVLDTLELSKLLLAGEEVLDVGSGGGVPGIILAILRPDLEVSLSESVGKRAVVLERITGELGLAVAVHACRAETVLEDLRFSSVVARAVGPLSKVLRWFQPHWTSIDRLLLLKGPRWVEERREARQAGLLQKLELRRAVVYQVPGNSRESVILQLHLRR